MIKKNKNCVVWDVFDTIPAEPNIHSPEFNCTFNRNIADFVIGWKQPCNFQWKHSSMRHRYTHTHSVSLHTVEGLAIMHKSKLVHTTFCSSDFSRRDPLHQIGHLMDSNCAKMLFTATKVGAAWRLFSEIRYLQVNFCQAPGGCYYLV